MDMLPSIIPKDWFQHPVVTYDPTQPPSPSYPPQEWFQHLWNYLRFHYPGDLSSVAGLPILPALDTGDLIELLPLALPSLAVMTSAMGTTLSSECSKILQVCGLYMISKLPDYVKTHAAVIGNYVHLPLPEDVLRALETAFQKKSADHRSRINELTSVEEKRQLRLFFSRVNRRALSESHKGIIRSLPLFELYQKEEGEGDVVKFVTLNEVGKAAPLNMPPIDISCPLVDLKDNDARTLAAAVGVSPLPVSALLKETVLAEFIQGKSSPSAIQPVMSYIIQQLPLLMAEDPKFLEHLKSVPFVSTKGGQLAKPCDLFNPRSDFLQKLFYGEDVFPGEEYSTETCLGLLRQLGLREQVSVKPLELLYCTQHIEQLSSTSTSDDQEQITHLTAKAETILYFLNRNPRVLNEEINGVPMVTALMNTSWVPTQQDRPTLFPDSLPWFEAPTHFSRPSDVKPSGWFPLVGSVMSLTKVQVSKDVSTVFNWHTPPPVTMIIEQLDTVIRSYRSEDKTKYMAVITTIYDELSQRNLDELQEDILRKGLTTWIWHGDGFTSSDLITIKRTFMDLRPYIYTLPTEIMQYSKMFHHCGVKSECDDTDLVMILQKVSAKHQEGQFDGEEVKHDLQLVVDILNKIQNEVDAFEEDLRNSVLVPLTSETDTKLIMVPIDGATYCDTEWLRQGFDLMEFDEQDGIIFIHPWMPTATAASLGVPTLMSRMLHAEELNVTGFGQSESLTSRLKRLLEDYTDGLAIPKELIQNADDAGATEISFLYDERTNADHMKYLIDEGMKECHGPALWVHNDAVFTDFDFESITKLGGATKETQSDKIGKFGLGFNAVYNLTDVPSFISRNYIVIFDPHTNHLGRGIKDRSRPGIRIDMMKNKTLLRKLPDQFQPYNGVFGCSIGVDKDQPTSYDGTLFRLPLRTRLQASKSEIKNMYYDQYEMKKLLQMIVRSGPHLLLFTQNVTSVKVYHLAADAESPDDVKLMFHLRKEEIKVPRPLTSIAMRSPATSRSALRVAATKNTSQFNLLRRGTEFLESTSKLRSRMLLTDYDAPALSMVVQVSVEVEEEAKLISQPPPRSDNHFWLISFATGYRRSLDIALESMAYKKGYNPMAAVAVVLRKTEEGFIPVSLPELRQKGIVFCYLPLPTVSGLPVHINGAFAVQSDRRHLSERTEDDKDQSSAEWNEALLQDAVCRAYLQAIQDTQIVSPAGMAVKYFTLWPCHTDIAPTMAPLMICFYDNLVNNQRIPTWHDGSVLVTMDRAVFLDPAMASRPTIAELAMDTFKQNKRGANVVELPTKFMKSLNAAGHADFIKEKTYTQTRFFREVFFADQASLGAEIRDPLVLYALDMNKPEIDKLLMMNACIPVSPNGKRLCRPSELVHPLLQVAKLYSPEDGRFPHGPEFLASQRLGALQKLGMQDQDLSWNDVVERAQSINSLAKADAPAAKTRLKHLLNFLDRKLTMMTHSKLEHTDERIEEMRWAQDRLRQTEMLPLMPKPRDFPLPWKGDEYEENTLMAPEDVHVQDVSHLVSSTQPIVDDLTMTAQVKHFLGMTNRPIAIEHIMTQLEHALVVDPKELTSPRARDDLNRSCLKIYDFLQMKCMEEEDTAEFVTVALGERKCILVGDEFLTPSQLSFSSVANCAPFLYGVPGDMVRRFKPLFKQLGVRSEFSVSDFIAVNHDLHQRSEKAPLKGKDLELALTSLAMLNTSMKRENLSSADVERNYGTIYIPNVAGVLQPASELCYNDCPWLQATGNMNFTHTEMTYQASALLGVKTKRQEALSKHAHGIPFGQKERLTNSLKRILNSYPCDHEILKELIQNADDAEATEIHFVKDGRHHSEKHVFENSWKPLQGPALCVYNNKPFKTKDLEGIQRLGEGSKVYDPNKTGQYGIGFSSVYHLTDAPSLLTSGAELGETLCVFDPHCLYVPGATPAEPGMQFSDLKTLRETFPDVFACYLEDIFKLNDATVFRFPLRTREMALKSELSKTNMTMPKMQSLLEKLKSEAFEILLFTNNITRISISDIDSGTGKLVNAYSVWAELSEEDEKNRHDFFKYVKQCAAQLKEGEKTIEQMESKSIVLKVKISDTTGLQETWIVSQHIGFPEGTDVPETVQHAFYNRELMLLPRGGTACLLEKRLHGQIELDNRPRRVFCFLPLPVETSLPVQINGHFALGYENRRHLWTNADGSGYKQEWNNFVCSEVISVSYLNLMMYIRMQGLNAEIDNNVAKVLCTRVLLESAVKAYQQYFPNFDDAKPQWDPLVQGFYQKSAAMQKPLLPALRESQDTAQGQGVPLASQYWDVTWLPPIGQGRQKAFFSKMDDADRKDEEQTSSLFGKFKSFFKSSEPSATKPDNQILKEVLQDCDFKVLEATQTVINNYIRSGVDIDFMSPGGVLLFFQSFSTEEPMCDLGPLPVQLIHTPFRNERTFKIVLNYCKRDPDYLQKLNGTPLLLTNDCLLRAFDSETPVFYTKYYDIIPECGHLFLHRSMQTEIFQDINIENAHVFAPLTIEVLATILHYHLPEDKYHNTTEAVKWSRSYSEPISAAWIQKLWTFLRNEVESVLQDRDLEGNEIDEQLMLRLKPVEDWAIIPAKTPMISYLISLKNATDIIDLRFSMSGVRDVLRRLLLPELAVEVLNTDSTKNSDLLHRMVTTLERPMVVLQLIHRTVTKENSTVKLIPEETYKVLKFFSENVDKLRDNEEAVELLRALPFYRTIHGDLITLSDCLVYTLPAKIPTNDIDVWQSKSGTVFLERNDTLQPLYDFLGCATINTVDVYCQFILQHFEYFSPDARTVHLQHLYRHYLKDNPMDPTLSETERCQLLQSLQDLNFIEDKDGELHPASDFYDPENVLFRVMLPEEKLPPRAGIQFRESEWLSFLRKLGLQSEVTKEQVVGFAQQVAHEGKQANTGSAIMRSKVLTEHLLRMQNAYREEILDTVSDIKFISPEQVRHDLSGVYSQYGDVNEGHLPYVSFKDSLSKDYDDLIWTRASLLPSWADPMKQQDLPQEDRVELMECLGIHKKPPINLVVSHLITLCEHISNEIDPSLKTDMQKKRVMKDVFRSVYRYLQDNALEDLDMRDRLSRVPCILVDDGKALIDPQYAAMNMYESEEIRPYLYKVPVELGEFHLLFHSLGSSDAPTVDQYASVLRRLHDKAGAQRLTPNELVISYKAVKGIFAALENTSSKEINASSLYLPSESANLVESHSLVFNDTPHFYDRVQGFGLQFLFDVKECGVKFKNIEDLLGHLPKRLSPGMLSTYVKEVLVDKAKQSITRGGIAADLGKRLTCESFMRAVMRLVRHETHRSGRKLDDHSMFEVLDRLSTIKVYAADLLQTQLTYNGRLIRGSQVDKTCFVEKIPGRPDIWNVYIRNDAALHHDLLIPLAEVINSILAGILRDSVLYLLPILSCPENQIKTKLDSLNVRLDQSQATTRAPTLPTPGSPIHPDHLSLLSQSDSVTWSTNDYVAYKESEDGEAMYAVVTDQVMQDAFGELSEPTYLINLGEGRDCMIAPKSKLYLLSRR